MLTIVHGNDILSSRKYFIDQKDSHSLTFDAESLTLSELEQSLHAGGLFEKETKIFIDNLFSRKSIKSFDQIVKILSQAPKNSDIYIWSEKEIPKKIISLFPNADIKDFKIPQNIFAFVDNIKPGSLNNVASFRNALSTTDVEIIFAMLIRQFRLMIGLLEKSQIDEVKRLAPWQIGKLTRQASAFGIEKLKSIYGKIYEIDKKQKTGGTSLTLVQNIDILMLEI